MAAQPHKEGELQPGCMADRLLTNLGQPQINPCHQIRNKNQTDEARHQTHQYLSNTPDGVQASTSQPP